MQAGVFLGELGEARRMIGHPAMKLRSLISDYLLAIRRRTPDYKIITRSGGLRDYVAGGHLNWREVRKLSKVIADTWLEYSFGWRPLVHDIEDAVKAYKSLTDRKKVTRIKRQDKEETETRPYDHTPAGGSNFAWKQTWINRNQVMVIYNVGVSMSVSADATGFTRGREAFGLTIEQFVPTLWELMPWSFLLDYFANIGDILQALATVTSDVTWAAKTVRKSCTSHRFSELDHARPYYPYNSRVMTGDMGFLEVSTTSVSRAPTTLTVPTFQVRLPGLKTQWANMAALVLAGKSFWWQLKK
jgi:hypothetical protein